MVLEIFQNYINIAKLILNQIGSLINIICQKCNLPFDQVILNIDFLALIPLKKIQQQVKSIQNMNFIYWNCSADIGFWSRLAKKKVEQYKLDSDDKPLIAKYRLSNKPEKLSILSIDAFSFGDTTEEVKSGPVEIKVQGKFKNTNTVEQYKNIDVAELERIIFENQQKKFEQLINGEEVDQLYDIFMLIFGDFKKHTFKYQFLSPAQAVQNLKVSSWQSAELLGQEKVGLLNKNYVKQFSNKGKQVPQFLVLKNYSISSLKQFLSNPDQGDYLFCISDMTNFSKSTGYHTSTILSLFAHVLEKKLISPQKLAAVKILLMKQYLIYDFEKDFSFKNSQIVTLDLSNVTKASFENRLRHKKKQMELDLKSFMDEKSLAKQAVDLNIKLMKWRLLPTLDIPKIQSKKCLLFGAGTLGCQLARNLIGWGIKHISFIDYSTVSYSNPVRQSLYQFQDTQKGGKPKAQTAAQKLKRIYPEIVSQGYNIEIPMPGHYVTKEQHIKQTFQTIDLLQKLVEQHDVLFLLLDSRQARWLPTVLANKYDKACITVGLGFDSYVIVRHGVSPLVYDQKIHKERICCYFCNDIVTPMNTMKDRTLDQMCTVTRPGLSFVSAAYASELYVSLIHHQLQHKVWAHQDPQKLETTDLGKLPHHLRGNMSDFENNIFYGKAFEQCVACSKFIVEEYVANRDEFMLKVLNDPSFIHQVTKLQEQLDSYENMECNIIEITSDDQEGIMEIK